MAVKTVKETVIETVRQLPDTATWEDIQYNLYVQQGVAAGIADIEAGRVHSHEAIRKMFNVK